MGIQSLLVLGCISREGFPLSKTCGDRRPPSFPRELDWGAGAASDAKPGIWDTHMPAVPTLGTAHMDTAGSCGHEEPALDPGHLPFDQCHLLTHGGVGAVSLFQPPLPLFHGFGPGPARDLAGAAAGGLCFLQAGPAALCSSRGCASWVDHRSEPGRHPHLTDRETEGPGVCGLSQVALIPTIALGPSHLLLFSVDKSTPRPHWAWTGALPLMSSQCHWRAGPPKQIIRQGSESLHASVSLSVKWE